MHTRFAQIVYMNGLSSTKLQKSFRIYKTGCVKKRLVSNMNRLNFSDWNVLLLGFNNICSFCICFVNNRLWNFTNISYFWLRMLKKRAKTLHEMKRINLIRSHLFQVLNKSSKFWSYWFGMNENDKFRLLINYYLPM